MDNFDMSRVIHDIETIKLQMKILQEAQETSLAAHVTICREKSCDRDVAASPTHSTGTPPTPLEAHTPIGNPTIKQDTDVQEQRTNTPREHRHTNDDGGDDEDLRRLAIIQGRLSFTSPNRPRDRRTDNDGNRDSGNNQHGGNKNFVTATVRVWRGRLNSDHHGNANRPPNMNHGANPNWVNNPRGDHGHRRQARDNNAVITGTRTNSSLSAATPRGNNPRQSRKDRLLNHACPGTLELFML